MPLSVISPSILASPPSRVRSPSKLTTGWRSASKNSGESRWPCRFSSFVTRLAIFAEPARRPSASVASNSLTEPVNIAMPMYGTSNETSEWTASTCQVPVGIATFCCSVMLMCLSSNKVDYAKNIHING